MCYSVYGMVHIKESLLLIRERVAHVAAAGFRVAKHGKAFISFNIKHLKET